MNILQHLPNRQDVERIWDSLPHARLVGGVVRDLLINKPISDIDLATPEQPDEIMARLQKDKIKVIPTGLAHGTVTAVIHHRHYEITTLRKDVLTDGRHATVAWTSNWQEDAARRDFTINAIFCDRDGKIWDFFNGQQDLKDGRIRFVGHAAQRISEDVLRILRFFRFYARYGWGQADVEALQAIQQSSEKLKTLSAERIWSELRKILIGPKVEAVLRLMEELGVLSVIFPLGYDLSFFSQLMACKPPVEDLLRFFAIAKGKPSQLAHQFRLSKNQEKYLQSLAKFEKHLSSQDDDRVLKQLLANYPLNILISKSWLCQARILASPSKEWDQWRKRLVNMELPIFPIKGQDIVDMQLAQGPEIGCLFQKAREWWVKDGCNASRAECLAWLKQHSSKE